MSKMTSTSSGESGINVSVEPQETIPWEPDATSPQESEAASLWGPEAPTPREPEDTVIREAAATTPLEPEPTPRKLQDTVTQNAAVTTTMEPESTSQELEAKAPRKPEGTTPRKTVDVVTREPAVTTSPELEQTSPLEPVYTTPQELAATTHELEGTTPQQLEAASLREPKTAFLREPGAATPLEPEATTPLEPEATTPLEPVETTPHKSDETSPLKTDAAYLRQLEAAASRKPDIMSQKPDESHQKSIGFADQEDGASIHQGGPCAKQRNSAFSDNNIRQSARPSDDVDDDVDEKIKRSIASLANRLTNIRTRMHRPADYCDQLAEAISEKLAKDEEIAQNSDARRSGSSQHQRSQTKGVAPSKETSANGGARPKTTPASGDTRLEQPPANGDTRLKQASANGDTWSNQDSANGGTQPSETPANGGARPKECPANADARSREVSPNRAAQPGEIPANGGARSKETPVNGRTRPLETPANGGARPIETPANRGARPKDPQANRSTQFKEPPRDGSVKTKISMPLTDGSVKSYKKTGYPSNEQEFKFRCRGHPNHLLELVQDKSFVHMVFPSPCFNNHSVHFGFLKRGIPTENVEKNFVEQDDGFPIFVCEEAQKCSNKCPVTRDEVGFPVVAMSFDSFCRAYHVEADNCQECRGGNYLARASITGRARLIYEQMNGSHPQQAAFRIWEHERGIKVKTSRGQPPPNNTLISVEKAQDRDLKPQDYEHMFSVLLGLRGIQSLFAFISACWNRTSFAYAKRGSEQRRKHISLHVKTITSALEKAGVLQRGEDNKLRGTVPAQCRPGKDVEHVEAEVWFPRVDRNVVEMQWLQSHGNTRVQANALDAAEVAKDRSVLWGTMISVNEPMAEKYYLDMPFSPGEAPAEEQLISEKRLMSADAFRQTFLAQLKTASGEKRSVNLGPHYSWNGVLYTWKLRRWPEDCVKDLLRPSLDEEDGDDEHGPCTGGVDASGPDTHDVDALGTGSEDKNAPASGNEGRYTPGPGDNRGETLSPSTGGGSETGHNNEDVSASGMGTDCFDAPSSGDKDVDTPSPGTDSLNASSPGTHGVGAPGHGDENMNAPGNDDEGMNASDLGDDDMDVPGLGNESIDAPGPETGGIDAPDPETGGADAPDPSHEGMEASSPDDDGMDVPGLCDESVEPPNPGTDNMVVHGSCDECMDVPGPGDEVTEISGPDNEDENAPDDGDHGPNATQLEPSSVANVGMEKSKTENGAVRNMAKSSNLSLDFLGELPKKRKLDLTSPQQKMQISTDQLEEINDEVGLVWITRVKSKDSGYPHSIGSESGTGSWEDLISRGGSLESGSGPQGSNSPSSFNSDQDSPVDCPLGSGSDQCYFTGRESRADKDLTIDNRLDSASDKKLVSDPDVPESISLRSGIANNGSEQFNISCKESTLSAAALKEWTDQAALNHEGQKKDTTCEDDDNTSDVSTIKGSTSTLTKGSRRRSSGDISGGSDFDDAGSAFSKSFSPSKSSGQNSRAREEGGTGEALQAFVIPEEHNMHHADNQSGVEKAADSTPKQLPVKIPQDKRKMSEQSLSATADQETSINQLKPSLDPDQPEENDDDSDCSYAELSRLPQSIKLYAHVTDLGIQTSKDETVEVAKNVTAVMGNMAGKGKTPLPSFMRIDDRKSVNSRLLRSLSAKDFRKQLRDAQTYKYLLNVSSCPEAFSKIDETELSTSPVAKYPRGLGHPQGEEGGISSEQVAQALERIMIDKKSENAIKAEGSDSSSSSKELPPEMEGRHCVLHITGMSNRALKKSPLKFLSTLISSFARKESDNISSTMTDINEFPFGLSIISRRQIKKDLKQANFICRRMIMQRGASLDCFCGVHIGDQHLKMLATKLENMLGKGRILQFLDGQRMLLDHVCEESVMGYVHKSRNQNQTTLNVLNDLMLILGLHHDSNTKPLSYCRNPIEDWYDRNGKLYDPTPCEDLARLSSKDASLLLARHHVLNMRQTDFFDPARDDPLTCMTLHEHSLKEPKKAMKQTPFQLFLEWHLHTDLLQGLCDQLNEYAKRRDSDGLFRSWTELVPDEMRVFLLQMVYISSKHSRDKRWDAPPRPKRVGHIVDDPDDPAQTAERSKGASSTPADMTADGVTAPEDHEGQTDIAEPCNSIRRPNMARLHGSMSTHRFRQIAATWRVFDFCEPPRRSERRRRLKRLQTVLDGLVDGRAVATLPALLAVGFRSTCCKVPPVTHRNVGSRRADLTLVMDGKRYVHDVVVTEARRRQRFRHIHPNVVNRIRSRMEPPADEVEKFWKGVEEVVEVCSQVNRSKPPSAKDITDKKRQSLSAPSGEMHRFYYMDGLHVSEAERCADNGIFCMAPIPPDDPRWSEFTPVDEDMPSVVTDNGLLTGISHGSRDKVNFFHSRDSRRRRFRLVCSTFHELDAIGGRRALHQVETTQKAVREAVQQVTSRLSHGSTRSGLRYYHRLFLRALSACIQNAIIARAVARKRRTSDSTGEARESFDSSASSLAAHCDAEFETFLSELLNLLEATPRVKPPPQPKLTAAQMHAELTADLLGCGTVASVGGMRSEMLVHDANKRDVMLQNMAEKTRQVGDRKAPNVTLVNVLEQSQLF